MFASFFFSVSVCKLLGFTFLPNIVLFLRERSPWTYVTSICKSKWQIDYFICIYEHECIWHKLKLINLDVK